MNAGEQENIASTPSKTWLRALEKIVPIAAKPELTLPLLIDSLAERFASKTALLSTSGNLSFKELSERSRRYSSWAVRQGLKFGDVVCLLMPNCPEYLAIWLGITRVGGIVALLNTHLVGESLAYSINTVTPKHVIAVGEPASALADIAAKLSSNVRRWGHGENVHGFERIDQEIEQGRDVDLNAVRQAMIADRALYIYTSGTTGLPKAVKLNHFKLMEWSHWFAGLMDVGPTDRIYNCLPMYHSVGGVVAIGAGLVGGGSVVLRERFSASQFWRDVVESDCTIFQYIGELCRYLTNTAPCADESRHRVRLACGNGLGADVWTNFQQRFHIPQILEFYSSTEGNFSLFNVEGRVGSMGRIPGFLKQQLVVALVKFDVETEEPMRNSEGFCVRAATNETGEAIGKIQGGATSAAGWFEGYTDKAATEKKILRGVFEKGDAWFRTGDLMRIDQAGFYYFVDRVGDTFRWKGENVSTTEVAAEISHYSGIVEAVVYGVAIPNTEGRAGMVAAVTSPAFDLLTFRKHLLDRLPEYARPLFLRIRHELDATGTFKQKKNELALESYDPAVVHDPIYFNDPASRSFVRLDATLFAKIQSGKVRL